MIEVTELGIVIEVKLVQKAKAALPIEVTELGITVFIHPQTIAFVLVFIIALQLLRESYCVFPLSTTIEVKPLQPMKAQLPMEVTELGMVNEVKAVQ